MLYPRCVRTIESSMCPSRRCERHGPRVESLQGIRWALDRSRRMVSTPTAGSEAPAEQSRNLRRVHGMKSLRFAFFFAMATAMVAPATALAQLPVSFTGVQVPITMAPPAPQAESQTPQPGPGFLWIAGHWLWNGVRYIWNPGCWRRPPEDNDAWEAPRWTQYDGGWRYLPGHWRQSGSPSLPIARYLSVTEAPPAMQNETPPPQPTPAHVWVAGQWAWNGSQYTWDPGHWREAPQPGAQWSPGHWYNHHRHWFYSSGHW